MFLVAIFCGLELNGSYYWKRFGSNCLPVVSTMPSQQRRRQLKARAKSQAATKGIAPTPHTCDLPGCGNLTDRTIPCCAKHLCRECLLELISVCVCHDDTRYGLTCPFCRAGMRVPGGIVKETMAHVCPSHAKVMQKRCDGGSAVVAHTPCEHGCDKCSESVLTVCDL